MQALRAASGVPQRTKDRAEALRLSHRGWTPHPIADYQGLGGEFFIGRPKQPTLTICTLSPEGRYDRQLLHGDQRITSAVFPNLNLTAKAVLGVG